MRMSCRLALCVLAGGLLCLAAEARADTLYADTTDQEIYAVNTANASASLLVTHNAPTHFQDIAIAPDGTFYGVTSTGDVYAVDLLTGDVSLAGSFGAGQAALDISASGLLYGAITTASGVEFTTVNLATSTTTSLGVVSGFAVNGDLAFARDGALYMSGFQTSAPSEYGLISVDLSDLSQTSWIFRSGVAEPFYGMDFVGDSLYGVTRYGALYGINPRNGATALVGGASISLVPGAAGPAFSAIPEPTTLALFGLGAGALALRRRKRKLA